MEIMHDISLLTGVCSVKVFDACGLVLPVRIWIVIMLPIVTVFTWVRNLDTLAPLSFVGNISLAFGLGSILYYIANRMAEKEAAVFDTDGTQAAIFSMTGLPVFFGNALFTYEAIGMVNINYSEYNKFNFHNRYFQLRIK